MRRASAGTRIIWRSGGLRYRFCRPAARRRRGTAARGRRTSHPPPAAGRASCTSSAASTPTAVSILPTWPYENLLGRSENRCTTCSSNPRAEKTTRSGWSRFTRVRPADMTSFRDRLLPGRRELFNALPVPAGWRLGRPGAAERRELRVARTRHRRTAQRLHRRLIAIPALDRRATHPTPWLEQRPRRPGRCHRSFGLAKAKPMWSPFRTR